MKIMLDAHVLGKKQAGVERYWTNLLVNITNIGEFNKFIVYSSTSPSVNLRSKFNDIKMIQPRFDSGLFRILWGLNNVISKEKPDVLYVNFFTPLFKRCRTVSIIHDLCFLTYPELFNPFFVFFAKIWLKKTIRDSDFIICPSNVVRNDIVRKYKVEKSRIAVIYEAADPIFTKLKNKNKTQMLIKRKFDIKGKYFLVAGDLDQRNMSWLVIGSFLKLLKENKDIKLVFTGRVRAYRRIFARHGNSIKVLNYVSNNDLVHLYNGSLAVFNFSICEGFGLPILEGRACGVPVVCNSLDVFKEIAGNECIYADNSQELTQKMKFLIHGTTKKTNDKNIIKYSWKKTANETYLVLNMVVEKLLDNKEKK